MKKIILYIIIFFAFLNITNATVFEVWSLPSNPTFNINKGDDVEYLIQWLKSVRRYDKTWVDLNIIWKTWIAWYSYTNSSYSNTFETTNYFYYWVAYDGVYNWSSTNSDTYFLYRYDKNNKVWNQWQIVASRSTYSNQWFYLSAIVDENKLVFSGWNTKKYVDITNPTFEVLSYTWTVTTFVWLKDKYSYRVGLNTLMFLDEANKSLEYYFKDIQWDIVNIQDVFVSTYYFKWYSYLYDTASTTVYFSIFWNTDVRSYYNYEIWTANYLDDRYYPYFYNWEILLLQSQATMWYNYNANNFWLDINLINIWWEDIFYFASWSTLYKDSNINVNDYLINIWSNTVDSWTWTTDTDITNIFDTDLNWDGDTSYIEAIKSIFVIPGRIFSYAWNYITKLKEFVDTFLNQTEPVFKNITAFNFIESTNAWFFTELIVNVWDREDEENLMDSENQSIIHKFKNMLQYWLYFLIFKDKGKVR